MTAYYVSSLIGSNNNAGTSAATPLATLQAAADLVRPGDAVEVMNGTYTGPYYGDVLNITASGTAGAPITFEAAPGQTPIIDSSGCWQGINIQASYIIIKGFTVKGAAADFTLAQALAGYSTGSSELDGNGIFVSSPGRGVVPNHITIENNTVFNEPGGGIGTGGADYVQILNNVVHDNAHWSAYGNSGISIWESVNSDTKPGVHDVVSGNISYNNTQLVPTEGAGIITDGEGIILDTNPGFVGEILVQGNTTYGNSGPGIESFLTDNAVITGNTAYGDLTNPGLAREGEIFINQSNNNTVTNNITIAPAGTVPVGENDVLVGTGKSFSVTASQSFTGAVASFSDSDPVTPASDLAATINWGDGTAATAGTVTGSAGSFTVSGTHTYTMAGTDTVTVTLSDDAPGTATATATGTASVAAPTNAPPVTVGTGPDTLDLKISEDAWGGDAQFTVSVDGKQIGGTLIALASHAAGAAQDFLVEGIFGPGSHTATINFVNDAYGGTPSTDRNLYVTGATIDGQAISGSTLNLFSNGPQSFGFQGKGTTGTTLPPVTVGTGPDTLDLKISEDVWGGDAQFTVSVDGKQIGGTLTALASHAAGTAQDFLVEGIFGPGSHTATIDFINDAYGGTPSTDRNLYVTGATIDGQAMSGSTLNLFSDGPQSFGFQGTTNLG